MDDGAYGAEIHHLRRRGLPMDAARFANPDFAAVARSLGADGLRLERLADAAEIGARVAGGLERPLLVHVEIDGDVVSPWFSELVEHATRFLGLPGERSG